MSAVREGIPVSVNVVSVFQGMDGRKSAGSIRRTSSPGIVYPADLSDTARAPSKRGAVGKPRFGWTVFARKGPDSSTGFSIPAGPDGVPGLHAILSRRRHLWQDRRRRGLLDLSEGGPLVGLPESAETRRR